MGGRIAERLLSAGRDVVVWNRSSGPAGALAERGAAQATTPAEAAAHAEAVLTVVADAAALRAVSEGDQGIAAATPPPQCVIEMSTVGTEPVRRLRSALPATVGLLDVPMLGSTSEAEKAALKLFAGGDAQLVESVRPLLETLGSVIHVGPLGSGAAAKLVANSVLLAVLTAVGEALALADAAGLSRETAFEVLATTPLAEQAERRRPSLEGEDQPKRFALRLARKDADLILDAARATGLALKLAEAARDWLTAAEDGGLGEQDYSAVLRYMLERGDTRERR